MAQPFPSHRAVAEIDTAALAENFRLLTAYAANATKGKALAPQGQAGHAKKPPILMAVVKANAYGHGISPAVPTLCAAGCTHFAVATLAEALAVRALAPTADILILGYTPPHEAPTLATHNLTQTVFSPAFATALNMEAKRAACRVRVHIKVDGGMCRLGFSMEETDIILATSRLSSLKAEGLYTHFPAADTDTSATLAAFSRFLCCRAALAAGGFTPLCHAAASSALLTLPETALDMARVGLALYGIPPVPTALPLMPVMRLVAPIVQIHTVEKGTEVGYGGTYKTARHSRIGTLPIGYADGFSRGMKGFLATWKGANAAARVPVVGNVCMDQTMVDLTDTGAKVGDTVCLWQDPCRAAAHLSTIPYEIVTALSPRVERYPLTIKEPNPPGFEAR